MLLATPRGIGATADWRTAGGDFDYEAAYIVDYISTNSIPASSHPLYARTLRIRNGQERFPLNIQPWIEERLAKGMVFSAEVNRLLIASGMNIPGLVEGSEGYTIPGFTTHVQQVVQQTSQYGVSNATLEQMGGYNAVFNRPQGPVPTGSYTPNVNQVGNPSTGNNNGTNPNVSETTGGGWGTTVEQILGEMQGNKYIVLGVVGVGLWLMFGRKG